MLAILNSLNAYNFPTFQLILMILVSKFMVHRALFDKTYLSLRLLSPLSLFMHIVRNLRSRLNYIFCYNLPSSGSTMVTSTMSGFSRTTNTGSTSSMNSVSDSS